MSYTPPPLQDELGRNIRTARSPTRKRNTSGRRRSVSRPHKRTTKKRDTWRSRSRRKDYQISETSSSEGYIAEHSPKRRHRSGHYNGRRQSSVRNSTSPSTSSSSSTASSERDSSLDSLSSATKTMTRYSRKRTRTRVGRRKRSKRSAKTPEAKKTRTKSRTSCETDFFKKFAKLLTENRGGTFEGAHNVIPEFDPDANSQTAADWIRKVNDTAAIYKWSDKQIVYRAIPKLTGYAKKWYEGRSSVNLSWQQWQRKILRTFPDDRNYADRLHEMLERRSKREEPLEEYFHDKMRLVKMCEITGRNAVDCVINGIYENNIRLNAQGSNLKRPSQLLTYLRRISKRTNQARRPLQGGSGRANYNDPKESNASRTNSVLKTSYNTQGNKFKDTRCYNCSELGHTSHGCPKPVVKCGKCSRLGHETRHCRLSNNTKSQQQDSDGRNIIGENKSDSKRVLQITKEATQNGKYFKDIKLNDIPRSSYVDFGSQCTLIKTTIAKESNLVLDKVGLPVIKGFGSGVVLPLGRVTVTIEIDAVIANVEVYVVADDLLNTDVLIGQSVTELPSVTVYKTSTQLTLYCDETRLNRLEVLNSSNVTVDGMKNISVHVNNEYTGFLFIPGYMCLEDNREHCILQGAYEFISGKGRIILVSFSNKPFNISENKILSRATILPYSERLKDKPLEIYVNSVSESSQPEIPERLNQPITMDMLNIGPKVSDGQKNILLELLNRYRGCFAFNMQELGMTKVAEMTIRLSDDIPVTYKPYRLPFSERAVVREMVGELLANNIIKESHSAYASPIVLVRKKNNEYRLCIDYRALNKKTVKDSYPMPVIDDQLDRLYGKTFFTSLDLASGYYQIPVQESSRHLTAFITSDGHYEFTRMPFGLVNAPAVFQNMINKALGNRRFDLAIPYLDDLLSTGSTFEESFQKLEEILDLLSTAGLTLNLKKCFFFQSELDYLGYQISEFGLRPGTKKIRAVSEFPTPTNVHQVRQFVGLASFFRRFIYNFASLAKPLTKLTKADASWQWGLEQEDAFQNIKSKLVSRPILALYNPDHATEVHCDASKIGVGGVLLQKDVADGQLRPVAYFSRQTTREESFWHSYELETMAVVLSLKKFRVYLLGLEFKVMTDCVALRTTLTKRDLLPKVARWWLMLQEFNFTIEYRPGLSMQHVDALSRNPMPIEDQEEIEILQITTSDWLHTVQMTDPRLKHIKAVLNTSEEELKDFTNNYVLRDDRLYRRVGRKHKWVVPHGARWRICQINHDEAGHFSLEKTLEKISADYWFPKMKRFIKKYVASCINCAYNKEMSGKKTGYLHPIPKVASIFHTLHIDHLGPFIKSKRSNTYILGVIDGFSKYIFVKAVRNTKSKTTIKTLEDIFSNFGCPKIIISDQGTSFTSNEFKAFLESFGIKHVLNAVATPRANGQIERYNRTILNSLSAMNHNLDEKDWDLNVPKLQWSLNNTLNKGIGKSPAEVVFGQRTAGSSENIIKAALEPQENNLEEIRRSVEENIQETQKKMKESFDSKRAPTKIFKGGDLVMIPNHNPEKGKSKKLAPKFRGPFKITAVLDKDRYEVSNIEGHSTKKYKNIYPADHLKPWITCHGSPPASEESNRSSSDESN